VNTQSGDHALFLKGCQDLLLLVLGNSMTAIDTSSQSEPRILWSKTLSTTLVNRQNSRDRGMDQRLAANSTFPRKSVFVSSHVVCVWDANHVYGLDPLTGETLWVRKVSHDRCSVLGDDENLFLVFHDTQQVIALDSASGREIDSVPLPAGIAYFVYGTGIVFAVRLEGTDDYALHACDLRDIHDRRLRAVQTTNVLPSRILHSRLTPNVVFLQMLHGDRFLSVADWGTKSLQIHDLRTKETLLPDRNSMLQFVSVGSMRAPMRCDVEFVEDSILVLFTKDTRIRRSTFIQVNNVPAIPIGEGEMMLFDSSGNPRWSEPTSIETIFRLWDVPARLPVMLFAVSTMTRENATSAVNVHSTRLMGVDKRSGEFRFRKIISAPSNRADRAVLQGFRVTADPLAQEITFAVPNSFPPEIVKVFFTDGAVIEND
jgi:hypothetical protein